MSTRRIFLQQTALIGAGILAGPSDLFSKPKNKIGLQLYTLRDLIVKDPKGVLTKVAEAGFKEVETFGFKEGFWGLTVTDLNALFKNLGLKSPSGHYDFDAYFREGNIDSIKPYIDAAKGLGQNYLTVPYLGAHLRKSLDSYKDIAAKLSKAAVLAKQSDLQLTYHNHDFEFIDFGGKTGYDIIVNETDANDVKLELDIYWTVKGGQDPIALFQKHPGRFVLWHVKDMDRSDKSYTEVGAGTIDYKKLFANAKLSGMKHFFVEQDIIKIDPYQSINQSLQYIKKNIL